MSYNHQVPIKNTHDLILEYLQSNPPASAAEISSALHLTKAGIRYHLNQLLAQQVITKVPSLLPVQKGRPTQLFRLSPNFHQHNLANLAGALLTISADIQDETLHKLAELFIAEIPTARQRTAQLNRLIAFLNHRGYQARWEAYANGPRILFRNCPYAEIISSHPELCKMDTAVISAYLKLSFQQTARIDQVYAKIPACIFLTKHHNE